MSASTAKSVDILCRNCFLCTGEDRADCGEVEELRRAIAEAQLEAVGNFKNRLCSVFVNTMGLDFQGKVGYAFIQALEQADAELRKAAGKGE